MLPIAALLMACLGPAAFSDVHVVDPGGGPGFALLQQAVAAAAPGDIIVLRDGDYTVDPPKLLLLDHKAVSIVADEGVGRLTLNIVKVNHVNAGETAVLRGVDIEPTPIGGPALQVVNTAGLAWFEDVRVHSITLDGGAGSNAMSLGAGGNFGGHVAVIRSELRGGDSGDATQQLLSFGQGGYGLNLSLLDVVAIMESSVRGGDGCDGVPTFLVSIGGAGIDNSFDGGTVFLGGSTVQGGNEGSGNDAHPGLAGDAVHTLFVASSWVYARDSQLLPGQTQGAGLPGEVYDGLPEHLVGYPAVWRSLELPAVVRERHVATAEVKGQPGDLVGLLLAVEGVMGTPLAGPQGALLLPASSPAIPVGVISSPSGELSVGFMLPKLPAGVDGLRVFAQGVFVGADGLTLGSGSAMAWIADSF